jgi:hypothetical protein
VTPLSYYRTPIKIYSDHFRTPNVEIWLPELLLRFAQNNGFSSWQELVNTLVLGNVFEAHLIEHHGKNFHRSKII